MSKTSVDFNPFTSGQERINIPLIVDDFLLPPVSLKLHSVKPIGTQSFRNKEIMK